MCSEIQHTLLLIVTVKLFSCYARTASHSNTCHMLLIRFVCYKVLKVFSLVFPLNLFIGNYVLITMKQKITLFLKQYSILDKGVSSVSTLLGGKTVTTKPFARLGCAVQNQHGSVDRVVELVAC
jgi:hypothetical protein